jgi:ABC-type glycerol-3-phosphate transport system substrate-binding protein
MGFRLNFICYLFFSFLFICCNQDKSDDIPEIVYNCSADAYQIKQLNIETEKYEKENSIRIKIIPFSGEEKLLAMMAANQEPDIFYTNNIFRDRLAAEGRIIDLRTVAEKDPFLSNLRPETIEQGKSIDGGWYHLCNWTFTYAVYYNKSIFMNYNIPFPKSDWTWEDMVNIAKKLTVDNNNDNVIDQYGIYIAPHFISAFEKMNHSEFRKNSLFVDIPKESIEVYQMYIDLFNKYNVMPSIERIESMGMQYQQLLENGKIAMIVEAVPNPDLFQTLKIDWDMVPLPGMNTKAPLYFRAYGGGMSISSRCKYPDKTWQFLKWLVFESSIFSPNPMLNDTNFVGLYENKFPILKNTGFREVWNLSQKFNGGDSRDFVRYSSWSAMTILERMAPALESVLRGKEPIEKYVELKDEVNRSVVKKVREYLSNPSIKKEFRDKIEAELNVKDNQKNI